MKPFKYIVPAAALLLATYACGPEKPAAPAQTTETPAAEKPKKTTPVINYTLVKTYPHDKNSFTEGFLFHDGQLYESSGDVEYLPQTRSLFGSVDLKTGKLNVKAEIDKNAYFGEGITFLKGKVYQLTLTTQVGFIYDAKTFQKMGQFGYRTQGWGLTTQGSSLIMSDGTNYLTYLDPVDFHIIKVLNVTENDYAVDYLNELEYINGYIYANVWMKNEIVKIDTASGEVVGKLVLDELAMDAKKADPNSMEMNGIAYDSVSKKILVTGKMWPEIFEIEFEH